jgi:hypothetical protein
MLRSQFAARLHQLYDTLTSGNRREVRRLKKHRSLQVESLEGRALMATINAAATISSVADGSNFNPSVNANSVDQPGMPVGTSFVYPGAPFSDAGHELTVTSGSTPSPTPSPMPTPAPTPTPTSTSTSPVTVTNVTLMENRKHVVTQIIVDYSGPVNSSEADSVATYRLATPGKKGSFTAKNAMVLKLKSAAYDAALDAVTLTPKKAFALTKPVQFVINGQSLEDSTGQLIDGGNDDQAGSDYVSILQRTATAVTPALAPKTVRAIPAPVTILRRTIVMPARTPTPAPISMPMPGAAPTPTPISMPFPGY